MNRTIAQDTLLEALRFAAQGKREAAKTVRQAQITGGNALMTPEALGQLADRAEATADAWDKLVALFDGCDEVKAIGISEEHEELDDDDDDDDDFVLSEDDLEEDDGLDDDDDGD